MAIYPTRHPLRPKLRTWLIGLGLLFGLGLSAGQLVSAQRLSADDEPADSDFVQIAQFGGSYLDIDVDDGRVYLIHAGRRLDVLDAETGERLGSSPELPQGIGVDLVSVVDGHAYLGASFDGFLVLDVEDPDDMSIVAHHRLESRAFVSSLLASGGRLFVSMHRFDENMRYQTDHRTEIFDISEPAVPSLLGQIEGSVCDRCKPVVQKGHLFTRNGSGLNIIDVRDPSNPVVLPRFRIAPGGIPFYGDFERMAGGGDLLVTGDSASLSIIDVSDPSDPKDWAAFGSDAILAVAASADRAFVAMERGIRAFDLSTPDRPRVLDELPLALPAELGLERLVLDGDRLHMISTVYGYSQIDLGEGRMQLRQHAYGQQAVVATAIEGDRAYLADAVRGLDVLDISDPLSPRLLSPPQGLVDEEGLVEATGIALVDDVVYLATTDAVRAYRLEEAGGLVLPREIARFEGPALGLATTGRWVLAGGKNEVMVIDASDALSPRLQARSSTRARNYPQANDADAMLGFAATDQMLVILTQSALRAYRITEEGALEPLTRVVDDNPGVWRPYVGHRYRALAVQDGILALGYSRSSVHEDAPIRFYRLLDQALLAQQETGSALSMQLAGAWLLRVEATGTDSSNRFQIHELDPSLRPSDARVNLELPGFIPRFRMGAALDNTDDWKLTALERRVLISNLRAGVVLGQLAELPALPTIQPTPGESASATPIPPTPTPTVRFSKAYIPMLHASASDLPTPIVADAEAPIELQELGGAYTSLAIEGDRAYLIYAARRLEVRQARSGEVLGTSPISEDRLQITDIAVEGGIVYLGIGREGILILDARDPDDISVVSQQPVDYGAFVGHIEVSQGVIFAGAVPGDLYLVDVSDPRLQVQLGSFDGNAYQDLVVHGDRLYALHSSGPGLQSRYPGIDVRSHANGRGVSILDIQDPRNPRELSRVDLRDRLEIRGIAAWGDRLLAISDGPEPGLYAFDVSNPEVPFIDSMIALEQPRAAIAVHAGRAYVATGSGIVAVDVDDPVALAIRDRLELELDQAHLVIALSAGEAGLYAASNAYGYSSFELDGGRMALRSHSHHQTSAAAAVHIDNHLFLADRIRGLVAYDLADPGQPRLATSPDGFSTEFGFVDGKDILVESGVVYLATGTEGLLALRAGESNEGMHFETLARFDLDVEALVGADGWIYAADAEGITAIDARDGGMPARHSRAELHPFHRGSWDEDSRLHLHEDRLVAQTKIGLELFAIAEDGGLESIQTQMVPSNNWYVGSTIARGQMVARHRALVSQASHLRWATGRLTYYRLSDLSPDAEPADLLTTPWLDGDASRLVAWTPEFASYYREQSCRITVYEMDRSGQAIELGHRRVRDGRVHRLQLQGDRILVSRSNLGLVWFRLPPHRQDPGNE